MVPWLVAALAAVFLVDAAYLGVVLHRGGELADQSRPFVRVLADPSKRLLVIGDSTGVGTGAESPDGSVAGRLAAALPHVEVVNKAEDGAKTAELLAQLELAGDKGFDVVLIQVGGNDVLRFTDLDRLRESTEVLLDAARQKGAHVTMMSSGDVGAAPAFPPPVDWIYSWRTRKVRALFLELADKNGIDYVDLYNPSDDNPFYLDPERYYAGDGLHPSAEGYRLWYEKLIKDSSIGEALALDR
ncbi:MAG: SGNH/GDSL hydrolase family protein [Gammaproteobacteria bacterium]|nr:SGNH/GDSL hydrolase family protein [Gammaproteobacteria bacterium]